MCKVIFRNLVKSRSTSNIVDLIITHVTALRQQHFWEKNKYDRFGNNITSHTNLGEQAVEFVGCDEYASASFQ